MGKLHILAFDSLSELDDVADAQTLLDASSRILGRFGYSAFVLSRLPRVDAAQQPEILLNGWPSGWNDRYEEAGHYGNDPVASFCSATIRPFAWTEIPAEHMHGPRGERIVHEAAEFGLTQGLCIPVHTTFGTGGMSLAGTGFEEEPGVRQLASLLAFKIATVLEQVGPPGTASGRLTARERDVLSWVAMGKTAEEIGVILSISAHTVGEHMKKVRAKLNASNNAHCIVKALQSGQLQL